MEVATPAVASMGSSLEDHHQLGMTMSPAGSAVSAVGSEDEGDLRRGPWTVEEDVLLVNYIAKHGEGRWNSLARSAGLKRTGKSCRLRWLNYLRPDVRRGNITPEEQLLILELHSRWGNRWSKIAAHLPGRTDNEIKNYWRTRVQKHARQLRCDVNSARFREVVRYVWMPRLVERIQAAAKEEVAGAGEEEEEHGVAVGAATVSAPAACQRSAFGVVVPQNKDNKADDNRYNHHQNHLEHYCYYNNDPSQQTMSPDDASSALRSSLTADASSSHPPHHHHHHQHLASASATATPTNEGNTSIAMQCGDATGGDVAAQEEDDVFGGRSWSELLLATTGSGGREDDHDSMMIGLPDFQLGEFEDNLWSLDDLCLHQQCS